MNFFNMLYGKEGPGVPDNEPEKKGFALFWDVFRQQFWELIKLNLTFLLSCVPIITIPAAIKAMSHIAFSMFQNKHHYLWEDYWASFKDNFIRSTVIGLIWILMLAVTWFGLQFYLSLLNADWNAYLSAALAGLSILIFMLVTFMGYYIFPMDAKMELKVSQVFRNALLLSILRLPWNILTLVVIALICFLLLMFFPFTIIIVPFFSFSFISFIATFCAYTGLKKYVITEEHVQ